MNSTRTQLELNWNFGLNEAIFTVPGSPAVKKNGNAENIAANSFFSYLILITDFVNTATEWRERELSAAFDVEN